MQDIIGAWLYPFLILQRIQWDVPRVLTLSDSEEMHETNKTLDNIPLSPNTCYSV